MDVLNMDATYFRFNKHFLSYPFAKNNNNKKQKHKQIKCLPTYWFKNIFIKKKITHLCPYILSLHILSIYWHLI